VPNPSFGSPKKQRASDAAPVEYRSIETQNTPLNADNSSAVSDFLPPAPMQEASQAAATPGERQLRATDQTKSDDGPPEEKRLTINPTTNHNKSKSFLAPKFNAKEFLLQQEREQSLHRLVTI
jgi:hypothetical protein